MRMEKLSTILDISIGRTPSRNEKKYWGKGHKWVSIRDLNAKTINSTSEEITDIAVKEARCKKVPEGTLLFSFKLTIGKMAFAGCDLYTNEAIAAFAIKDKKQLSSEYLYFALQTAKLSGSNQAAMGKTLNSKSLAEIQIPLPSLDDQLRIAHLLSKVEGLVNQRKRHLQQLDELLKSVFLKMFGGNFDQDYHEPFGNHIEVLTDYHANGSYEVLRKHVKLLDEPNYALMVRTTDLEHNNFEKGCNYITKEAYEFLAKSKVFGGEIIINKIGSAGKVYLMPELNRPVSLGMNAFLVRLGPKLNAVFTYFFLTSDYGTSLIQKHVKGAVTKTITKEAIRSIKLPIPDIEIQKNFVAIVEKIEVIKSLYQQSLSDLEALYGALSQKAFKGELDLSRVPLNREKLKIQETAEDDPMDELLSESMEAMLSDLNAFNKSTTSLKAVQEAIQLSKIQIPQLDSVRRVADQLAALRSPVDELKRMSSISNIMDQLSPNLSAIKAFSLEHSESVKKSVELARKLSFDIPKVDMGWIEHNSEVMKTIAEPFESMRKAMEQISMSSTTASLSLRLPSEIAKQLQGNIPDFTSWLKQSANPEAFDIDEEEEAFKRSFTREDVAAIFAKTAEPISFDELLLQLSDLETVNLAGYETIKDLLFELLAEQKLTQFFDKENKTLLLGAAS